MHIYRVIKWLFPTNGDLDWQLIYVPEHALGRNELKCLIMVLLHNGGFSNGCITKRI